MSSPTTHITDGSPLYERTYERLIRAFCQQKGSKARPWCIERNAPDMHLWDNIATINEALTSTNGVLTKTAGASTPEQEITFARRRSQPAMYNMNHLVDGTQIAMMCTDPKSSILEQQANAFGRWLDRKIFAAAIGNTEVEAGTPAALPAGSQMGGATQDFDFTFVLSIAESFMSSDIDPSEEKVVFIRPNAVKKMLAMSEATSSDYVNAKALAANGVVEKWMGFTWIVSNLMENVTGLQYYYIAMTRNAMGLHWTQDFTTHVDQRADKNYAWQIYTECAFGATRLEEARVRRLHVLES